MSNPILILNQPQIFNGLGTLTYTIPSAGIYSVVVGTTFPTALAPDSGAGSGVGLGSGAGGGDPAGFARGGLGLGNGGVGQSVGNNSGYQQPPAYGSNITNNYAAIASGLSIVVNQNGSPIYTANAIAPTQGGLQFKTILSCSTSDAITVVLSSSTLSDEVLNGLKSQITIQQGA